MSALSLLVSSVTIQSNLLPDITVTDPFGALVSGDGSAPAPGDATGNLIAKILRPQFIVVTALGTETYAPFGQPFPWMPYVFLGGLVMTTIAGVVLIAAVIEVES